MSFTVGLFFDDLFLKTIYIKYLYRLEIKLIIENNKLFVKFLKGLVGCSLGEKGKSKESKKTEQSKKPEP